MSNVRRVFIAFVAVVGVLLAGIAIGAVAFIQKPIPDTTGTVSLTGLDGTVTVTRDSHGIPTITADTAEDLFFAEGFVHAQDRFHEMDVRRHVAAGTLSALIGARGHDVDSLVRALRLPAETRRMQDDQPPSVRRALDAYARGVNAYTVGKSGSALALEYTAKTLVGHDYRPASWTPLDSVGWDRLLGWNLHGALTDQIDQILIARQTTPERLDDLYPGLEMHSAVAFKSAKSFRDDASAGRLLRLRETIASVPRITGLPSGPGTGAWIEQDDGGRTRLDAQISSVVVIPSPWYQIGLRCRHVTVKCPYDVSGLSLSGLPGVVVGHNANVAWGLGPTLPSEAHIAVVRRGRKAHGAVVAPLAGGARLAIRSGGGDERRGLAGVLALDQAADASAAVSAAPHFPLPFALVYLDKAGTEGQEPSDPAEPPRADERSSLADLLVPSLLPLDLHSAFASQGQNLLRSWDRQMSAHSAGAAYFAAVWRNVLALTFHDELPRAQWPDGSSRWRVVVRRLLAHPAAAWWDNLATPTVIEHRDDILREAMVDARNELTMMRARDVRQWDWSDLHSAHLRNPTLDGRLFERGPVRLAGSGETLESTTWDAASGFATVAAPVARLTMRLERPDTSTWVVATGASGHAFADHYTDQTGAWSRESAVEWPFSPAGVERSMVDRLTLTPPR